MSPTRRGPAASHDRDPRTDTVSSTDRTGRVRREGGWLTDEPDHLAVAVETAAGGWPVFPCLPDKRPATRRGFHDATLDPDQVHRWWTTNPGHLVGTPTAGLVVVDLDEPTPPTGATWAWWTATAGPRGWQVTDAPIVATPRGGLHVYFAAPEGTSVRNSAGKLAAGVDVRGDGGYVIAPGSTLPDGRGYHLLEPHPAELPAAPGWLLELIDRATPAPAVPSGPPADDRHGGTRYGLGALEAELGRLATAHEGIRNDTLVRAAYRAGQLVAGGQLDAHHAAGQLEAVATRIGLGATEAASTIRSGMTSGARQPRRPAA